MITAEEALELSGVSEVAAIPDAAFQQYLNRIEADIRSMASRKYTRLRFWCNEWKFTSEEEQEEERKAMIVARMLATVLRDSGYSVQISPEEPWLIIVDWSKEGKISPDKPMDLTSCQKMLDEYVQRGEKILRMCHDAGLAVKFGTSNRCQMKYYLTTKDNSFDAIFKKPDKSGGFIQTSGIPDARRAYADMMRIRLGQEGVELFLNLEKDIADAIHAGCSDKYYMKNDCHTHRMYNLISDHYMVVKAWMDVMGYSFTGYQDDNPRYRISWDIEENK